MSDQLDPVRRLGAPPPAFDAAADQRVRDRMAELLRAQGHDLPEALLGEDDGTVVVAIDRADDGAGRRAAASTASSRRSGGAVRWVGWAAVVVLVAGLGLWLTRPAEEPPPTIADYRAAVAAGTHTTIGPGEELLVVTDHEVPGLLRARSIWHIQPDGSGQEEYIDLLTGTTTTQDADLAPIGGFGYPALQELPDDPVALEAAAQADSGANPMAVTSTIMQLLTTTATPPAVRAAALDLLVERGATVVPDGAVPQLALDGDGTERVVLDVDLDAGVITRITTVDPRTGAVVQTRTFLPAAAAGPG